MNSLYDDLLEELQSLLIKGNDIIATETKNQEGTESDKDEKPFLIELEYHIWYTSALNIVEQFIPKRSNDFQELYRIDKRKNINVRTYTISDYLLGIRLVGEKESVSLKIFAVKFHNQLGILASIFDVLSSKLANIKGVLQADIFDNEIDSAEELLRNGHIRPAGVLAGVTLEKHLETVCKNHDVKITKRNRTIDTYNTALKAKEIYDVSQWRFIQHLGDLRNKCAHKNTNEPTKEDAQDLIDGVKKIIKTVF